MGNATESQRVVDEAPEAGQAKPEKEMNRHYFTLSDLAYTPEERKNMSFKYLNDATKSTCMYNAGHGPHGPIIAKGQAKCGSGRNEFDICDLHLENYRRNGGFYLRLNYGKADSRKDISSDRAVARRQELSIGLCDDLRSKDLDARKDLL
jgi:hypothetical protein